MSPSHSFTKKKRVKEKEVEDVEELWLNHKQEGCEFKKAKDEIYAYDKNLQHSYTKYILSVSVCDWSDET